MAIGLRVLPLAAAAAAPVTPKNIYDYPNPQPIELKVYRTWEWSYNLKLIGQDVLPIRSTDRPNPYPVYWYRQWEWNYNPNLIGKDKFPIRQMDWPNPRNLITFYYWIDDNNWSSSYTLSLIGKDKFYDGPGKAPVFDYPNPIAAEPNPRRSWTWEYNKNLIGKDRFPPGQVYTTRPDPVTWYKEWVLNLLQYTLSIVLTPQDIKNQFDWPLPKDYLRVTPSWSWNYNLNLIGQDLLPIGEIYTQRPDPVIWYREWLFHAIQLLTSVFLVPTDIKNQFDWPLPKDYLRVTPSWTYGYILELIGQDKLPPGTVYVDRPPPVVWYKDWALNLLQVTLAPVVTDTPKNQLYWPLPLDYLRTVPSWTWKYNDNLIGQDVLPFNQKDWPLADRTRVQWYKEIVENLLQYTLAPPVLPDLLKNKRDWPLPRPVYWYVDHNQNLVLRFFTPGVVTELHFRPIQGGAGRGGNLGGLS